MQISLISNKSNKYCHKDPKKIYDNMLLTSSQNKERIRQNFVKKTNTHTHTHTHIYEKVNQSHYRPEVPRGFQEVKAPRLHDNDRGWW